MLGTGESIRAGYSLAECALVQPNVSPKFLIADVCMTSSCPSQKHKTGEMSCHYSLRAAFCVRYNAWMARTLFLVIFHVLSRPSWKACSCICSATAPAWPQDRARGGPTGVPHPDLTCPYGGGRCPSWNEDQRWQSFQRSAEQNGTGGLDQSKCRGWISCTNDCGPHCGGGPGEIACWHCCMRT